MPITPEPLNVPPLGVADSALGATFTHIGEPELVIVTVGRAKTEITVVESFVQPVDGFVYV